ncbi:MAG: hypothetical protein B6229_10510 [Spirochaetaceae bacterium 4572_7]|nr:MAG: hypothetical protein B6229_10510 [Spirochaetaceae bacterium 4572_7]
MKRFFLLLIICFVGVQIFALTDNVDNTSLHNKALGGPHSAMVKGFDSFFNNPALLSEYDEHFSIAKLDFNLKGDALSLINLYLGGSLSLDDPSGIIQTLTDEELTRILFGLTLPGPISIGYIGNNWGWSVKNTTDVYLDIPSLIREITLIAREDLQFAVGISFPIPVYTTDSFFIRISPGIMSRTTIRGEMKIDNDLLGLIGTVSDIDNIMDTYPIYLSPIFGLDGGFLVNFNDIISLSGVVKDIYTPILKYPVTTFDDALNVFTNSGDTSGALLHREINFGLAGDIPLGPLSLVVNDLDVYFDYFDLLLFDKNPWLHLGMGVDINLLGKFHLLAGFNEGLLALGLNVELKGFNIGFSMYGTEESPQPGMRPTFNFLLSTGISF